MVLLSKQSFVQRVSNTQVAPIYIFLQFCLLKKQLKTSSQSCIGWLIDSSCF